ncbi:response regulator transcription factor [Rhodanobacter umsongensis]|uniref:Response regulator transcription factor n=1 Tax=Rhodanobacter umsongensis TaxID=633153 RepID=A0ABW0JIA3_9GAMM
MLRILLVEDEPDIAFVASVALEDAGYHVTLASDGKEGLEMALQDQPELVLTDFMMPRLTGLEMIARLRDAGFHNPVVLATSVPEVSLPPLRPHYDAYLAKPYSIAQLLCTVGAFHVPPDVRSP